MLCVSSDIDFFASFNLAGFVGDERRVRARDPRRPAYTPIWGNGPWDPGSILLSPIDAPRPRAHFPEKCALQVRVATWVPLTARKMVPSDQIRFEPPGGAGGEL